MSIFKHKRRLTAVLVVVVVAGAAAAAYAAWTTSGSGPGKGKGGRLALVVTEAADLPAGAQELFPGQRGDIAVDVENPNRTSVTVMSWNDVGASVRSANEAACPSSNVTLAATNGNTAPISLSPGETKTIVLGTALQMSSSAPDGCQGVSFTVTPIRINATT